MATIDIEEIIKISSIIKENINKDMDLSSLEVNIYVDKKTLRKMNEELYYRNNSVGEPEETDEIIVNINDIKFRYVVKEE